MILREQIIGEDQKLGTAKETSCLGWSSFQTVRIFKSFVINIPKNFRKIISASLLAYYIQLSLLTVLFFSVSMSGKFANSLFPQHSFMKPQEISPRVLKMDALSEVRNNSNKKVVICIRITEDRIGQRSSCSLPCGLVVLSSPVLT